MINQLTNKRRSARVSHYETSDVILYSLYAPKTGVPCRDFAGPTQHALTGGVCFCTERICRTVLGLIMSGTEADGTTLINTWMGSDIPAMKVAATVAGRNAESRGIQVGSGHPLSEYPSNPRNTVTVTLTGQADFLSRGVLCSRLTSRAANLRKGCE